MNDRELLELAAKAAGHEFVYVNDLEPHIKSAAGGTEYWNPLTDDGDAFRLAVKLNLHVEVDADSAGAITIEWNFDEGGLAQSIVVETAPIGGDDYAATRRAIVRAAAATGGGKG